MLVRTERLELSHLSAPEPKSGASTNSATFARKQAGYYIFFRIGRNVRAPALIWCRFPSIYRCLALGTSLEPSVHPVILVRPFANAGLKKLIHRHRVGADVAARKVLHRREDMKLVTLIVRQ